MSSVHPTLYGLDYFWQAYSSMGQHKNFTQKIGAMHAYWPLVEHSAWRAPVWRSIFNTVLAHKTKHLNKESL